MSVLNDYTTQLRTGQLSNSTLTSLCTCVSLPNDTVPFLK